MRVLVVLLALAAPLQARADEGPMTRLSVILGWGQSDGALAEEHFQAYLLGVEAGVQWKLDSRHLFDIGPSWSLIYGCWDQSSCFSGGLSTFEMAGILRLRWRVPVELTGALYVVAEGGPELYRASIPVPPDDSRTYYGFVAGGGLEYGQGGYLVSIAVRDALVGDDPSGIKFLVRIATGGK